MTVLLSYLCGSKTWLGSLLCCGLVCLGRHYLSTGFHHPTCSRVCTDDRGNSLWFVVVSKIIIIIIIIIKVTTGHSVRNKNHNMEEIKRTGVRFRYDRVDEKYYEI